MKWLSLLLGIASSQVAFADVVAGTGLQISGAADIVAQIDAKKDGGGTNRLEGREAEITLYAPIDQIFDGVLSLAGHQENGAAFFEIHEMYIGSSRLIPRSRFRVGQFFLGFGRLNQYHRHDWPFTTAPKYHTEFFRNGEGVLDSGVEYSYLPPLPFYLDITAGITNGWVFGHSHTVGKKPYVPTHYVRAVTYYDLPWSGGMQTALNYVGRKDDNDTSHTFLGIDATAKWREAKTLEFLLQSEFWLRLTKPRGSDTENTLGFYIFPQYGFDPNWSVGVRFDGYSVLNLKDSLGAKTGNFEYGISPIVSYKASEFSTIRASYNHKTGSLGGKETVAQRFFELQAVFIVGSHPAHDF